MFLGYFSDIKEVSHFIAVVLSRLEQGIEAYAFTKQFQFFSDNSQELFYQHVPISDSSTKTILL